MTVIMGVNKNYSEILHTYTDSYKKVRKVNIGKMWRNRNLHELLILEVSLVVLHEARIELELP